MTRTIERLSSGAVLKSKGRAKPYHLADGAGLYLRVAPSGAKSWIYRFTTGGRMTDMGLGPLHTVGLKEARDRARQQRLIRLNGGDPIAQRRGQRVPATTFQDCAELYMASMSPGWSEKTAAQWRASLETYAYPVLGGLPIAALDKPAVLRVIAPLWETRTETMQRVRGR